MYRNMAVMKEKDFKRWEGCCFLYRRMFIPLVGSQVPVNKCKKLLFPFYEHKSKIFNQS